MFLDTMSNQSTKVILLGTNNQAKQERMSWLLKDSGYICVLPKQLSLEMPLIPEEGPSHESNARTKALVWSQLYGGLALASDGGLVIPALGSYWDSLNTHRFSTSNDVRRAHDLLSIMTSLKWHQRHAHWSESIALANNGNLLHLLSARSGDGFIARDVKISLIKDDFWVGSILYFPQFGKRYAELTQEELRLVGDHWMALKELIRNFLL